MPSTVRCPNPACGKTASVSDEKLGKPGRCKTCGQPFVLGDAETLDGAARDHRPAPTSLGRFEVRERLGEGAFGAVYRAYDPQLDREVALKLPRAGVLDDPRRVERFLREARAAAQLRHPHIVPVFDAGRVGEQYYIASAYIAGRTLADALERKPMEPARTARIARELAEAAAYAHEQGIVHRDIKPANVLLDARDRVHLMDFGLAARQDGAEKLTNDGTLLGTPAYMAPEQAKGQQGDARPAADQYAVGVTLYEMLTGRPPFSGPPHIVLYNAIHTAAEPPRKRRPEVPADLETICLKAMAKREEDRYPDCQALADDLRRWLEGEPILARKLGPAERLSRWARRNRLVATLSLTTALALVGGAVASTALALKEREAARQATAAAEREQEATRLAESTAAEAVLARKEAEKERWAADENAEKARRATAEAEEARRQAELRAEEARAAQKRAEELQKRSEEALAAATKADAKAADAARVASAAELVARRESYPRLIEQALQEAEKKDFAAAAKALASCPEERRGWEWGLLRRWCQERGPPYKEYIVPWRASKLGQSRSRYPYVGFNARGTQMMLGQTDGNAVIWDFAKGGEVGVFSFAAAANKHMEPMAFSPDGTLLLVATQPNEYSAGPRAGSLIAPDQVWPLKVCNAQTGKEVVTIRPPAGFVCTAAAFAAGGTHLLVNLDNAVERVSLPSKRLVYPVAAPKAPVPLLSLPPGRSPFCLTPDLNTVAGVPGPKAAGLPAPEGFPLLDVQTGRPARTVKAERGKVVRGFSGNGRLMATSDEGSIYLCDAATGRLVTTIQDIKGTHRVAFSPDGKRLSDAVLSDTETWRMTHFRAWNAETGQLMLTLPRVGDDRAAFTVPCPTPGWTRLVQASIDKLRVWEAVPLPDNVP